MTSRGQARNEARPRITPLDDKGAVGALESSVADIERKLAIETTLLRDIVHSRS
jgi:hypothetical protein